jgi:hypothetical protein
MKQVLNFQQLVQMNERVESYADSDGYSIADVFNKSCEPGLEVVYIGDSFWEFENPIEAKRTLDAIGDQDQKRCGLER